MVKLRHIFSATLIGLFAPIVAAESVINGSGSTFVMNYDASYTAQEIEVMNNAALFWANTVRSAVPIEVEVDTFTDRCSSSYNMHVNTKPPAAVKDFTNAPIANMYYPAALANSLAGVDLLPNDADINISFNQKMKTSYICSKWYLGYDGNFGFLQFSLYFETMQEIAHGLGLMPMGNLMTGAQLNGTADIYSSLLFSAKSDAFLSELSQSERVAVAHDSLNLSFAGSKAFEDSTELTFSRLDRSLLLVTRSYDALEWTGSHLHEATEPVQLMMLNIRGVVPETDIAVSMLEDLGWRSTRTQAPEVTAQRVINIAEGSDYTLSPADITLADAEQENLTISASAGSNYSLTGLTVIPAADFNGDLSVSITVTSSDGSGDSSGDLTSTAFDVVISVTPVNDTPVITGLSTGSQGLSFDEDSSLTLTLNDFTISDVDSSVFTLSLASGTFEADNYTVEGTTITAAPNFFGTLTVPVVVNDGELDSAVFNATVQVNSVNDAPLIIGQVAASTLEEQEYQLSIGALIISDVDSTDFTLSIAIGNNYTLIGSVISPNDNFSGELLIPITVSDGESTTGVYTFRLNVVERNDPPVLSGQQIIEITEDSDLELMPSLLIFADEDSTDFTVNVLSGANYSVVESNPAGTGNQILIPAENFSGQLTVPMQISDGLSTSAWLYVAITVTPVNDVPVLESVTAQSILEDNSLFVSHEILSIFDPDSAEFTIQINPGEHYEVAGNEIIPNQDWFGELLIDLTVNDGELDSNTMTLALTVLAVNDLPELVEQSLPSTLVYRQLDLQLNSVDIEADTVTFSLENPPAWVSISDSGLLSAYADYSAVGEHTLTVLLNDGTATTAFERTLNVIDDATATDVSTHLSVERTIWSTTGWTPVIVTVTNNGPKASVQVIVSIDFNGQFDSQYNRCDVNNRSCILDVVDQTQVTLLVANTLAATTDLLVSVTHSGYEILADDNNARLTLTFSDVNPTSPQFTVPSFGQGDVRAIGFADVQGGRWPEILFANGALQASTAYRFDGSIFNPVLHSHLADASDSYGMSVVDLDNDGDKDWVLANANGEANTVYLNDGEGHFTLHAQLGNYDSRSVAHADFDRDGDIDLVFANNEDPNTLYLNNGDGTFELFAQFESRRTRCIRVADFNNDGQPDLIFGNRGYRNRVMFIRGFNRFSRTATRTATRSSAENTSLEFDEIQLGDEFGLTDNVVLADFDGDGVATDIVFVDSASDTTPSSISVFNITEAEQESLVSQTESGSVKDISVGDYNGDGFDDLAVLRPGGALEVMDASKGSLNTFEIMDTDNADTILMVDIDGSGQADIISSSRSAQSSRLDFTGDVSITADTTDTQTTVPVVIPTTPVSASATESSASGGSTKSGAGVPLFIVLLLLMFTRRTSTQ